MMFIRPVTADDLAAMMHLATLTGAGFTSLPLNEDQLAVRIERVQQTWAGMAHRADQGYLFVLEDSDTGDVAGISAIEVSVGLTDPWYNYKVGTLVHSSRALNVYRQMPTLYLSNDYTGSSELCTLFLNPAYRGNKNGQLLSKARLMFIAAFQNHFAPKLIAEMRGVSDEQGRSPFWESLGRHFFAIDFTQADYLTGIGQKGFIAELMPKHPLYVDLLSPEARAVIGLVHPQTVPARTILEREGMTYEGYVDIFDAGPTLEAYIRDLRIVREGQLYPVTLGPVPTAEDSMRYLISNEQFQTFRAVLGTLVLQDNTVILSPDVAAVLRVRAGECVRICPLHAREVQPNASFCTIYSPTVD